MSDFIGKFTTAMVNGGIIPKKTHDIAPSDRFKRISQETDRGGKKSISYWLKIERDFAYGYARDFKTGAEIRFNSAVDDPGMTRADMARVKAMLKARQVEEDARIAERHAKIATRSRHKWALASPEGNNPYLDRKKIKPLAVRFYGEKATILVPVYEQGTTGALEMVSLQSIYADGSKQFPFGGKKTGCFCPLGQINPTRPLTICEGWATGVSLKMALGDDFNVIVAFDAGNLTPVAKALRRVYKTTPIIIAADNDPAPHHTGQKAAAKAQKAVPDTTTIIPPDDTGDGVDFNDLPPDRIKALFGIEGGGGGSPDFDSQPNQTPAKAHPSAIDWASALSVDGKNRIVATSLKNAIMYMLHHRDWQGVFAYDEFRQDVVILKCPPWADESKFKVESLSDIIITQAAASLEDYGLNITIDKAAKAIDVVAHENRFHSAREYFESIADQWDGVIRLETLAQDVMGCTEESPEYLAFVIKKWMTAAVKRVMEPGCKFDHVLILESQKQGLAKSEFLKCLATFNGERYHTDSISLNDLENKDTILKMQGHLIVELAELSGFSRKDDNAIKNWLTQTVDELRIPFARKTVTYPRQFVFAATTNNYDYLKDPTGNRRYWPVTVDAIIGIEELEEIKSMLWAEAVFYYREGLYIGPTPEENDLAEKERAKRIQSDAWDETVMDIISRKGLVEFTSQMVIDEMGLKTTEKNETAIRRVNLILRQNGYKNRPAWSNKYQKTVRVWRKGD